mmetsp:Transcript_99596/g.257368  ORF Transcript_99596/g.257368 Transcript_99596/m.257368 type:complete len:265 (-) Transcript_99596:658-1452(-)
MALPHVEQPSVPGGFVSHVVAGVNEGDLVEAWASRARRQALLALPGAVIAHCEVLPWGAAALTGIERADVQRRHSAGAHLARGGCSSPNVLASRARVAPLRPVGGREAARLAVVAGHKTVETARMATGLASVARNLSEVVVVSSRAAQQAARLTFAVLVLARRAILADCVARVVGGLVSASRTDGALAVVADFRASRAGDRAHGHRQASQDHRGHRSLLAVDQHLHDSLSDRHPGVRRQAILLGRHAVDSEVLHLHVNQRRVEG